MIKEITIKNFKIFKGLHRIALSTDRSSPATVVSTITASGKTTYINAVYWCLYGHQANEPPQATKLLPPRQADNHILQ